ncbi:MAG: GxxExxY protein [Chlorobiota bacterium]|nr:MAG: GxxExxY protein [Chlorobiota bacterium]
MIKEQYKYSEITSKILACAFEVHKYLGNGFQEVIYQRALEEEFKIQGLSFAREFEMLIFYKEKQIGTRRVDFLVENVISLELKAIIKLEDVHLAQAINYLEAYNLEIGMLLNFGAKSLEYKRFINPKIQISAIRKIKLIRGSDNERKFSKNI